MPRRIKLSQAAPDFDEKIKDIAAFGRFWCARRLRDVPDGILFRSQCSGGRNAHETTEK